jgi:hypothetical protein
MRGDEARIVDAFCAWLSSEGWSVEREVRYIDVVAERGDERLIAEAKGGGSNIGIDVDMAYGQLLRRMTDDEARTRFALVVPDEGAAPVLRVPARVRELLRIEVYAVSSGGRVRKVDRLTDVL